MAMEALSSNELMNFIIYDTICATSATTPYNDSPSNSDTTTTTTTTTPTIFFHPQNAHHQDFPRASLDSSIASATPLLATIASHQEKEIPAVQGRRQNLAVQGGGGRKKRRRRPKVCKNKEEAETQRMTHIAVERNRRKQMNEYLAVLRSLMPESYIQRGDQASIVGSAIEFVKELEHLLQSLEAQKFLTPPQQGGSGTNETTETTTIATITTTNNFLSNTSPFAQFFSYPQYTSSQHQNKFTSSKSSEGVADIEVTLIETHANLRILSPRRFRQLSRLVAGFHTLQLTILHLNVTTLDPLVLYSISAKVEEGCHLSCADDIAGAVHHMLSIIEEEAALCNYDQP